MVLGPRVHQPPPSATSAPPFPGVLRFPSTGIKNTHRLGLSGLLPSQVHFLVWPVQIRLWRGVQRGPSASPVAPAPTPGEASGRQVSRAISGCGGGGER